MKTFITNRYLNIKIDNKAEFNSITIEFNQKLV